jgi:hypothetical protein
MAKKALKAVSKSLSSLSDMLTNNIDQNPTITPVLDLSNVKKNVGQIDKVLSGARTISFDSAYSSAVDASVGYRNNRITSESPNDSDRGTTATHSESIIFNQYNSSPKALSPADLYRQTKNQLSAARGVLAKNAHDD